MRKKAIITIIAILLPASSYLFLKNTNSDTKREVVLLRTFKMTPEDNGIWTLWTAPQLESYNLSDVELKQALSEEDNPNNLLKLYRYFQFYKKNQKLADNYSAKLVEKCPEIKPFLETEKRTENRVKIQ